MQSFLPERDAVQAPRASANRPATELPPSLFGPSPCTVLKGSVIAESDHDLAQLFALCQPGYPRQNGPPLSRVSEPCATAPHRPPDATTGGNMMELEHVPKARLLVRHPVRRTPSTMVPPVEASPLLQAPCMATGAFRRSAGAPLSMSYETVAAAVPPYPSPLQHIQLPPGLVGRGHEIERNPLDLKGLLPESSYPPPMMRKPSFDVTSLGSLRYQNFGNAVYQTQMFPHTFAESFSMVPTPSMQGYGPSADPLMTNYYCDPLPPLHPPAGFSPEAAVSNMREHPRRAFQQNPYGMMIPTPRFVAGDGERVLRCSGPIELPEMKKAPMPKQDLWPSPQEMFDAEIGDGEQSILDFMDQLLGPDEPKTATGKNRKTQKKGKGGQSKGVAKPKTKKKATTTSKKGNARGRKQQPKEKLKATKASPELAPPLHTDIKTTLYDRIIAQQPEDGISDATCLLLTPQFTDTLLPSLDGHMRPCEGLRSSDRDDVTDVYRILEDAGLDFLPNENTLLPTSCPLLPTPDHMSDPNPENALEVAFTLLGKSVATIDELQSVMKTRLDLAAKGPKKNPGLELWPGWDTARAFSDNERGESEIVTCLKKCTDLFRCTGKNENGQELWECIPLVPTKKRNTPAILQEGKLTSGPTKGAASTKRKRKNSVLPLDFQDGPEIKSLRVSHTNTTIQSEK